MEQIKYIPILKWRKAEIVALSKVKELDKNKIMPIIEFVMPSVSNNKKDPNTKQEIRKTDDEMRNEIIKTFETKKMLEIPNEIEKSRGKSPTIIDFTLIYGYDTNNLKVKSVKYIIPKCVEMELCIIPLINLNDDTIFIDEVLRQMSANKLTDICIRITSADLSNTEELNGKLKYFMAEKNINESNIHILIDLGYLDKNMIEKYNDLFDASQLILNIDKWKSFIFASGSFPINMNDYKVDEGVGIEKRNDWLFWVKEASKEGLKRKPIFSDYTIRNPFHSDDLQIRPASATLKYADKEDWKIFRGQKGLNAQYLAHSNLLVNNTEYFFGKDFSSGDEYIDKQSNYLPVYMELIKKDLNKYKSKNVGGSCEWIGAGISHHLALVLHQLSNQL